MKITNKRENFLTLKDLSAGDVFCFLGDDEIYMLLDDKDYYVDLAEGIAYEIENHEYNQRIEWLNAELIIHSQLG